MTLEQFFRQYAALSMGDDDRALAAVYAANFFVAGPKGSMTFANDAKFIEWLVQVRAFDISYLMELAGNSWRVLGYVSARDQEEEMRALGLL